MTSAVAQTSLYYSFPITSTNWTTYSVPLVENGWTVGVSNGPPATQAQFQEVLGRLGAFYLQFPGSNVDVTLDNISLAGLATSTFDGCTPDGWGTPIGIFSLCLVGNPSPSIAAGLADTVIFQAPGKFLVNKSPAYGGILSLDVLPNVSPPNFAAAGTVVLVSAPDPSQLVPFSPFEWGYNPFGSAAVPPGLTNVLQVAAGAVHSLALRDDGTVVAWGNNNQGQTNVPPGLSNVISIAAGQYHNLALKNDGTVVAWGFNNDGNTQVPAGLSNVVALAANDRQSLALRNDGTVIGWGYGYGSRIVDPPAGLSNAVAIACQDSTPIGGQGTNLALRADGSVVAWAPVFVDTNIAYFETNLPAGLTNVIAIAAGGDHCLALKADGTVVGWGNNSQGQSGVPPGLGRPVDIAAGAAFSAALRADGTVVAWGDNTYNQTNVPAGLTNALAISAAYSHTVVLVGNGPPVAHAALVNPSWTTNGFSVSIWTQCGKVYALEYKNSLADSDWTPLPLVAGTGRLLMLHDKQPLAAERFYRIRRW